MVRGESDALHLIPGSLSTASFLFFRLKKKKDVRWDFRAYKTGIHDSITFEVDKMSYF